MNQWMLWLIGITLLLGFYAALCFATKGELLEEISGRVEYCNVLNQGRKDPVTHATIKTKTNSFVIAPLDHCQSDLEVTVMVKRGALFFNTVYSAEHQKH